jgi:protein-S-isoprenylcysteine O-methyltransferase Ste14
MKNIDFPILPIMILKSIFGILFFIALLFIPAGRLDWIEGWLFLGFYLIGVTYFFVRTYRKDPGLLIERSKTRKNTEKWDKVIIYIYSILLFLMIIFISLDAGRFQWSPVLIGFKISAWVLCLPVLMFSYWAISVNTFASQFVRVQDDRGHRVIDRGPYRYVRHPMYTGLIITIICIPLMLGAWYGLIFSVLIGILFVIRTIREDRTLCEKLEGYKEYTEKVKYRLIPLTW